MYITKELTLVEAMAARMMGFSIEHRNGFFHAVDHISGIKKGNHRSGSQSINQQKYSTKGA